MPVGVPFIIIFPSGWRRCAQNLWWYWHWFYLYTSNHANTATSTHMYSEPQPRLNSIRMSVQRGTFVGLPCDWMETTCGVIHKLYKLTCCPSPSLFPVIEGTKLSLAHRYHLGYTHRGQSGILWLLMLFPSRKCSSSPTHNSFMASATAVDTLSHLSIPPMSSFVFTTPVVHAGIIAII